MSLVDLDDLAHCLLVTHRLSFHSRRSRQPRTKAPYCPKRFYRRRHKIENFFCRIKDWQHISTRYDKLARNFQAATMLVGALYCIKL
jgi:transposase